MYIFVRMYICFFLVCKKFSLIAFLKRFKVTNFILFFFFFFAGRGNLRTMGREAWWTMVFGAAESDTV